MPSTALMRAPKGGTGKLWKQWVSGKRSLAAAKLKSERTIEGVVRSTEVFASAFVFGAIQGAYVNPNPKDPTDKPGVHIFGVPVEIAAGVSLHLAALLGLGGKMSDHLKNFGDGAIAAYLANIGRGWGDDWQKKRGGPPGHKVGEDDDDNEIEQEIRNLLAG